MVVADRGRTSTGKASGSGHKNGLTRYLFRECYGSEDDGIKAKKQEIKNEPDACLSVFDDCDRQAEPDQHVCRHGRLRRGSAHAACGQAFLRRRPSRMRDYGTSRSMTDLWDHKLRNTDGRLPKIKTNM